MGLPGELQDFRRISFQVAHQGVYLQDRYAHGLVYWFPRMWARCEAMRRHVACCDDFFT
jgi:hypothetical protein